MKIWIRHKIRIRRKTSNEDMDQTQNQDTAEDKRDSYIASLYVLYYWGQHWGITIEREYHVDKVYTYILHTLH